MPNTRGGTRLFQSHMALPLYGAFASRRRVSAAGACSTVLVRARGRRRTFGCNDRFSRSKLLLHVLAKRQPNPNIRMRSEATNSKLVRLLIPLYGSRHLSVHDAHAPATRLRRAARVHELTIAAGIDSSSTFGRQDGGVAPTDAKRVLQCHPESVRLRRSPAARTPGNWDVVGSQGELSGACHVAC